MTGILGHDSALQGYIGPGTTWANEMNFVMNHAPIDHSTCWPVVQRATTYSATDAPNKRKKK